jgi:uncharacterized protein
MSQESRLTLDTQLPFGAINPPPRIYRGMTRSSFYLPMRDGVRLAITLLLPKGLPAGAKIPALLSQGRYWREMELYPPLGWLFTPDDFYSPMGAIKPFFVTRGYALVLVDVRGTGASFGAWPYPWPADALEDARQIVDWIIAQPWSNGRVGGYGISYLGTTAELLAVLGHPAVKAVIPAFNHPDAYIDIAFPGGIFNMRFIHAWDNLDRGLDNNKVPAELGFTAKWLLRGVRPVDDDKDRALLRQAVLDHAGNTNIFDTAEPIACRDDRVGNLGVSVDDIALHHYQEALAGSQTAIFGWGSWMDGGTGDAALRRFLTLEQCQRAVVGAWEHGGQFHSSPYARPNRPAKPSLPAQWAEMIRFFDAYLKDDESLVRQERVLFYYSIGEEKWKSVSTWPPPGVRMQRWYLSAERALLPVPSTSDTGVDTYAIDYEASTGLSNRWWELSAAEGKSVAYPRRAEAGSHLLTYLSPPLDRDMEIAGFPVARLYLSSTETDGAVFVYLEDVSPNGKVTYLTEGKLRLIHRKVSSAKPPYCLLVPYHSFKREDAQPFAPGQTEEVTFGLLPVAALVRRGHRLRVGFAGHDQGTFARIPSSEKPVLTFFRGSLYPSAIELPVLG